MKKPISAILAALILLAMIQPFCYAAYDTKTVKIEWKGTLLTAPARILEGSAYLPLDEVGKALGYQVSFSQKDRRITVTKEKDSMIIDLQGNVITVNGHTYFMGGDFSGSSMGEIMLLEEKAHISVPFLEENFPVWAKWDKQAEKIFLNPLRENPVTMKNIKKSSEDKTIKITLQYPQITGLKSKAVQDRLNASWKKLADTARANGLNLVQEYKKLDGAGNVDPHQYETYFNYRIRYNRNNLISIIFSEYQYAGGAHGGTIQSSHTYNLTSGKEYKLKELALNGSVLTARINQSVKSRMKELEKSVMLQPLVPFRSIKSDQGYFLSNDSIVVYFQQYEYFPYAAGIQEFPTRYADLKGVLKPEFRFLYENAG